MKFYFCVAVLFSLLLGQNIFAQEKPEPKKKPELKVYSPKPIETDSYYATEYSVGVNWTSFDYVEELTAPAKSTERGSYPLLAAGFKQPFKSLQGSFFKFDGEGMFGYPLSYDGTTLSTNLPVTSNDKADFIKLDVSVFFNISPSKKLRLGPSIGYGYRYWKRYLTYGSGYNEIYTWTHLPLGFSFYYEINSDQQIGFEYRYQQMQGGQIKVITSETIQNGVDTTLTLGNKDGYRISIPFELKLSIDTKLKITPWYETSAIGMSDSKYNASFGSYITEPASKTVQYGLLGALLFTL